MAMLLSSTVLVLLVTAVVYCFILLVNIVVKFRRKSSVLNNVPHPPTHWLWGHLKDLPGPNDAGLKYKRDLMSLMPRINLMWIGFIPMINVKHPQTAKTILKSSEPKGGVYEMIKPWVGDGLLLSKGNKWTRNRRLLTPAFHFDILKPYVTIKNRAADIFLNKMEKLAKGDQYFEVFSYVSMYTLDVILKCAFSFDTDCQNTGGKHPYVLAVNDNSALLCKRFFKPWLHPSWIYNLTSDGRKFQKNCEFMHKVAEDVITKRKQSLDSGEAEESKKKKCLDFLDILLTAKDENGFGLSPLEIRNEVDTFLFEGHDTTASAISWTMFSLAEHPEHQEAIQREVDELMANKKNEDIEMDDLSKLTYLTLCVKESLRLHCPVPFIQRMTTRDMVIDGNAIPVGTVINIQLYCIHHNPLVWDNSLEFRPERFSPENVDTRDPYSFVPFSAGPRNCIGQNFALHEIKIFIARLLHKYYLELDPHHTVLKEEQIVMRAENGIRMKAILREKQPL